MRQTIPELARYDTVLKGFPKAAITDVATRGMPDTRGDVIDLTSRYKLTPDMVSTLIRETRGKPTRSAIEDNINAAKDLNRQTPTPRVGLVDLASRPIGRVDQSLGRLNRRTANPKVRLDTSGFFGAIGAVVDAR